MTPAVRREVQASPAGGVTPLPARAASADLIHAEEEIEEEDEDMRVPDPPQFSGEAGKDDLNTFTHNLGAWYFSARCVSTLAPQVYSSS